MDKVTKLYAKAFEADINIFNEYFHKTKKAACLHKRPFKNILIDKSKIESTCEEGILLAEEIGHYETGALYLMEDTFNMPVARSNRIKCEARAKHWSYEHYLSSDEIIHAIKSIGWNENEVAEQCEVTVEFLYRAIEYYATKGIYFKFSYE